MSDDANTPKSKFLRRHALLEKSPTLLLISSLLVVVRASWKRPI
ncbi:MAG: hypothetical protein AAGA31_11815 [Bacteroidota bacterium]